MIIIKWFIVILIWFLIGFIFGGAFGVKIGKEEEQERVLKMVDELKNKE